MNKFILFLLIIVASLSLHAQVPNDSLEYRIVPDSSRKGELYLNVHNFNFMRNYEFFNKFQDGYTLFGTQLEPQLVYYPHENLSVSAGVHLRKDFGSQGIYQTFPLFSVKYSKGHTRLINGVLEGSIHHRFVEPIYDLERRITQPVEYGTQFIIDKPGLYLDAFINWERMVYKPAAEQEQILGGLSMDIGLVRKDHIQLSLPLQLTAFHQGGQIDTDPSPLQTLVNTAVGFKLRLPTSGFFTSFRTSNYFLYFRDFSFTSLQAFENGHGIYLNAAADSRHGSLGATYWKGDGFIARQGMPVFQSVSQHINHEGYSQRVRNLLILSYSYQKKLLPGLYMDFRLEPLIDLGLPSSERKLQFTNSTFLVYRQEFRLKKGVN